MEMIKAISITITTNNKLAVRNERIDRELILFFQKKKKKKNLLSALFTWLHDAK